MRKMSKNRCLKLLFHKMIQLNILAKKPMCGTCINNGAGTFSLLETASENNTSPSSRVVAVVNESQKKNPSTFSQAKISLPTPAMPSNILYIINPFAYYQYGK